MSPKRRSSTPVRRRGHAMIFAALGDETRLLLVTRLCHERSRSISQLAQGSNLTRQAITKHLRVLEKTGIVRHVRAGREMRFKLDPRPMEELKQYLDSVSTQWDRALSRLKSFVEE